MNENEQSERDRQLDQLFMEIFHAEKIVRKSLKDVRRIASVMSPAQTATCRETSVEASLGPSSPEESHPISVYLSSRDASCRSFGNP